MGAADKIAEPLVEEPNADARRFSAEKSSAGMLGQTAKKVFLIERQRGIGFNTSAKSFHSLDSCFLKHPGLWQEV